MRSPEEIMNLYELRRSHKPLQAQMRDLRDLMRGDLLIPLNELDSSAKSSVANLTRQGMEQMAMRGASTMPQTVFMRGSGSPERAKERARTKSMAVRSWWDDNRMGSKLRKRMRHLWGYAASPVVIRPDFNRGIPTWQIRDPLATYPAQRWDAEDPTPPDCIFGLEYPWSWLHYNYGGHADLELLYGSEARADRQRKGDTKFTVIEYCDAEQLTLIALGAKRNGYGRAHCVLESIPNRAGVPVAIVPELISLDEARSPYADMPGMHYNQAYLQALNLIAVEQGIFPREWLVQRGNEPVEIVVQADGKRGITGIAKGGTIETQQLNPGYKTDTMMVQLERAQRLEAGIPAEFGAEASSTVRTARRGDQILSAAVDFRIQEIQDIMKESLQAENKVAIATDKAYWGDEPKSFYFTSSKDITAHDYVPLKLWDTDRHVVKYSLAGTDINTLSIAIGGRLGAELISKATGRELDPMIEDPEAVADEIRAEKVEDAAMAWVQQQVAEGHWTASDMALWTKLIVADNTPTYEALEAVQQAAQKRQQAEAEQMLPPEQLQPGVGPQVTPTPAVGEVPAGISNVSNLLSRLNRPRQVANSLQEGAAA